MVEREEVPSTGDINVSSGQGNAIKGVHNVKHQSLELKKLALARDQKEKEKKKETGEEEFASSDKGRVRDDGGKGGPGTEEQHTDSGKKRKKEKGSEVRGGLVDVVI